MQNLINANFNRTYNPCGRQNALSDIKRLLTSRDTSAQNKACGYLMEVVNRYGLNTAERARMIEYLLDNDIIVFLCEATSNLDYSLFRTVLQCVRLLWLQRRFFAEEHAAHAASAALRALAHYSGSGSHAAVDVCLHFLCDLLNGVSTYETLSPLSNQSAYSVEQLLACLNSIAPRINTNPGTILSSTLVLHSLVSYQPTGLAVTGCTSALLAEVLVKWFHLVIGALNHSMLASDTAGLGMFYAILCQLGMDVLRFIKLLKTDQPKPDLVHTILLDEQEIKLLSENAFKMSSTVQQTIQELVVITKENQNHISTEEYTIFLKFLLNYFNENSNTLEDLCEMLYSKGYLTMLPQASIKRNDATVRKISTLVLGEILKGLAEKYLQIHNTDHDQEKCAEIIHTGLIDLQYGIERPDNIGVQLQKNQPYSLLIYIYFYCQSSENPEEVTAPLLPYLLEHVLLLPESYRPPTFIVKALWLVFAMSTISNGSLKTLEERVFLEKATGRLVDMLYPEPSVYYTHNPAVLLWAFTSQRIPNYVKQQVLSQWLSLEDTLPIDLSDKPILWELLLNLVTRSNDKRVALNCLKSLQDFLGNSNEEDRQDFATLIWSMLPGVLAKTLIECDFENAPNISHLLDLATTEIPLEVDQSLYLKVASLVTAIFTKYNAARSTEATDTGHHYEYVCLKLTLYLLGLANNQNDNRVLITYAGRAGFLPAVLSATNSTDDSVACAALQLLSYIVHYYAKYKYQPKSYLQIQTPLIIKSLRCDRASERGASLLQLVYMVLNPGLHSPLVLSYEVTTKPGVGQQCNALRALMFRIQMVCCQESKNQSSAGWKTLSAIFKHAIILRNDPQLVATLTSQPWTHALIHFQITQNITQEFLTFTQNWLTLLRITIKKNQEKRRIYVSKKSLITKTLMLLKKGLVPKENELKELKQKTLTAAQQILEEVNCIDSF